MICILRCKVFTWGTIHFSDVEKLSHLVHDLQNYSTQYKMVYKGWHILQKVLRVEWQQIKAILHMITLNTEDWYMGKLECPTVIIQACLGVNGHPLCSTLSGVI